MSLFIVRFWLGVAVASILSGCGQNLSNEQIHAGSLLDCDIVLCVPFNSQRTTLAEASERIRPDVSDEALISKGEFLFSNEARGIRTEYGTEICDLDFSQWDYATVTVRGRIAAQSEPIVYSVSAYTADGVPNGNITLRYLEDGEWYPYNATIALNEGTECLRIVTASSDGPFGIEMESSTLGLFKNDDAREFPAIGPDNAWYAQKIVIDYIRADALQPAYVEQARGSLGQAADGLIDALGRNAPSSDLYAIAVSAPADIEVAYDFISVRGRYFLDRALAREQLPGLRSLDLAWDWGYTAIAAAVAFERTHDPRFANLVLEQYDDILAVRDSELGIEDGYLGRSLRAWGEQRPGDQRWWVSVTNAGMITYPMVKILADIHANYDQFDVVYGTGPDAKALKSLYLERRERYLESFQHAVEDLDALSRTADDGGQYYIANGAAGVVEAINHVHPLATGMVLFNDIKGDAEMIGRADRIGTFFEASMTTLPNNSCVYPYAPGPMMMTNYREDPENVWKANISLLFPYEAYRKGVVFEDSMASCLGISIADNVLNIPTDPNSVLWDTPKVGILDLEPAAWSEANSVGMLALYGEFDPRIKPRLVETVAANPQLFPDGWFHRVMMVGYAARLESNAVHERP